MTALADLTDSLKRELAVPGTFGDAFPDTTTSGLIGALADGFAEAQLDGFFTSMTYDRDEQSVSPDLSAAGAAMVVIYAGIRIVTSQFRAAMLAGSVRYKAGPVEFAKTAHAGLRDELKAMAKRRDDLQDSARASTDVYVWDLYVQAVMRAGDYELLGLGGFYHYEC